MAPGRSTRHRSFRRPLAAAGAFLLGVTAVGCGEPSGVEAAQDEAAVNRQLIKEVAEALPPEAKVASLTGQWFLCSAGPSAQVRYQSAATIDVPEQSAGAKVALVEEALVADGWERIQGSDEPPVSSDLTKDDARLGLREESSTSTEVFATVRGRCVSVDQEDVVKFDFTAVEDLDA